MKIEFRLARRVRSWRSFRRAPSRTGAPPPRERAQVLELPARRNP